MGIASYKDSVKYEEYKLQPGDRLSANIYSLNPEITRLFRMEASGNDGSSSDINLYTYRVSENGTLHFPYVGDIQAAGKSVRELKTDLEKTMRSSLGDCYVRVFLANGYYSVIGEAGSGKYNLVKDKMNIFEALAVAGDLGALADRSKIQILRQTPTGTIIKSFDIRSKDILHSEFYYIQPNDVIYVRPLSTHFFGVTSWTGMLGTITTTISMALLVVSIGKYLK
jgi:polysaccharide export outer membrane protein